MHGAGKVIDALNIAALLPSQITGWIVVSSAQLTITWVAVFRYRMYVSNRIATEKCVLQFIKLLIHG